MTIFNKGDLVRIQGDTEEFSSWNGLVARIVGRQTVGFSTVLLRPLTERPDGAGLADFYWDRADLVKIEESNSVADTLPIPVPAELPITFGRYAASPKVMIIQAEDGGTVFIFAKQNGPVGAEGDTWVIVGHRDTWEQAFKDLS